MLLRALVLEVLRHTPFDDDFGICDRYVEDREPRLSGLDADVSERRL